MSIKEGREWLAALCLYHTKCNPNKAQHPKSIAPQLFF